MRTLTDGQHQYSRTFDLSYILLNLDKQSMARSTPSLTPALIRQKFDDVLYEFFELGEICQTNPGSRGKNYVTTRLVTVIEQFCRQIIAEQIRHKPPKDDGLEEIKIRKRDLDALKDISKETVIAASYNFQRAKAINDHMHTYGIHDIFDQNFPESAIEELMDNRHDVVHTVTDTNYDIKTGYAITEELMRRILKKSHFCNDLKFVLTQGNYKLANKKFEEAIKLFDRVLEAEPDDLIALILKGIALGNLDKFEEAIKLFDRVLEVAPDDLKALCNKGVALGHLDKLEEAIKLLDRALEVAPDDLTTLSNKGVALYNLGKFEESIKLFDRVLGLDPDYLTALTLKGVALYNLGKFEESIKLFDRVLGLDPDDRFVLANKGAALGNLCKFEEAIKLFDRVLEAEPDDRFVLTNKGAALGNLCKFEEAIKLFDRVLGLDPDDLTALTFKGMVLNQSGRHEEAIKLFDRVLEADPYNHVALNGKNDALGKLGKSEKSIK